MQRVNYSPAKWHPTRHVLNFEACESRSLMAADFSGLDIWELSEDRIQHHRFAGPSEIRSTNFGPASMDSSSSGLRFTLQTEVSPELTIHRARTGSGVKERMGPMPPVVVVHGPTRPNPVHAPLGKAEQATFGAVPSDTIAVIIPQSFTQSDSQTSSLPRYTLILLSKFPQSVVLPIGTGRSLLVDSQTHYQFEESSATVSVQDALARDASLANAVEMTRTMYLPKVPSAVLSAQDQPVGAQDIISAEGDNTRQQIDSTRVSMDSRPHNLSRHLATQADVTDVALTQITQQIAIESPDVLTGMLVLSLEGQPQAGNIRQYPTAYKFDTQLGTPRPPLSQVDQVAVRRLNSSLPVPEGMIAISFGPAAEQQGNALLSQWMSASISPMAALQIFLRSQNVEDSSDMHVAPVEIQAATGIANQEIEPIHPWAKITGFLLAVVYALFVTKPSGSPQNVHLQLQRSVRPRANR